jgi:hypothetical protein
MGTSGREKDDNDDDEDAFRINRINTGRRKVFKNTGEDNSAVVSFICLSGEGNDCHHHMTYVLSTQ